MKRSWMCASIFSVVATAALADPIGEWRVADGTAHIQISRCGQAICGKIAWLSEKGVDENNPDPRQRKRSLLGLPILNLKLTGDNQWTGTIYNAKDGQSYAASLALRSEKVLLLEGCVNGTNICGGEEWTRVR
ncbi:hypothetical protein A1351_09675 [Methylosinus sp. R-45379]|jgi:uncharacterized protein (DUF2147 family)|uniref:DUF2147 domain-containing protein n=1 Tax=unclassified Methylosinus TaxID=2624500 RepID=UPI000463411C|nr:MULTISPECIES: DUF2147 domain-containing protein [unclassified Methylosinus]OAI30164.1 hypothetical protein A1351_09675 [Methylosinus sp. R-45379]TDX64842.1 uncharacterized protein (DUF2147 family) [Methylosinus sp. sav-2]